jgi:ketosteroid isomerase-like protein
MSPGKTIGALLSATALASALPLRSLHAQADPQREIQPLLDDQLVAANAHDTDRFLTAYLHDSTLVLVFNGVVTTGFTAVHDLQLKWWNNGKSDVAYSERGPAMFRVLGPDAVVVTQSLASRRTGADGPVVTGTFTATSVWQKLPQGWRIVLAHESTAR